MAIRVALVEYYSPNDEIFTSSGLFYSERFVLITAHSLLPFLKGLNLEGWFNNYNTGIIYHNPFQAPVTPKCIVTIGDKDFVTVKPANVVAAFICQNIMMACRKFLLDWAIKLNDEIYQTKELLSLFFILEIEPSFGVRTSESEVNEALVYLLQNAQQCPPNVGHEVFVESVPFGSLAFLNSYSQGIVSNIIGQNSCLLVTDCPSTPGSEGSPVFMKTKSKGRFVVAIAISCVNWWKGEWIGLTLTANLVPLLLQFKELCTNAVCSITTSSGLISSKLIATTNCLVQIISGSCWGTAVLINKKNGIFLTNSHVIESYLIDLYWKNHHFKGYLIYQTPNADVYDLAIFRCDPSAIVHLPIVEASLSFKPPRIGEDIFAAGYPLFQYYLKPQPTVTKGNISQSRKGMIKTTCCVLPGASGGAIFRYNGELIGIITSNIKLNETVYPHLNMAIPILAVYSIIEDFINTGDVEYLHKLHSKDSSIIRDWYNLYSKL